MVLENVEPIVFDRSVTHPWDTLPNYHRFMGFLNPDGKMNFDILKEYMRGISPIGLALDKSSFGRYLIYVLMTPLAPEPMCQKLSRELHYHAIHTILQNYKETRLLPIMIYNLKFKDVVSRIPRYGGDVTFPFRFGRMGIINIPISSMYLYALRERRDSMGTLHTRGGSVLVMSYRYANHTSIYRYGYRSEGGMLETMWDCVANSGETPVLEKALEDLQESTISQV